MGQGCDFPDPTAEQLADLKSVYCTKIKNSNQFPRKAGELRDAINRLIPSYNHSTRNILPDGALFNAWEADPNGTMIIKNIVLAVQVHLAVSINHTSPGMSVVVIHVNL